MMKGSFDQAADFDAIVVGSGISGGWAAKELTEKGLKVLVLERGKNLRHGIDYFPSINRRGLNLLVVSL